MLTLYCATAALRRSVRLALPADVAVTDVDRWEALEKPSSIAPCCVLVIPWLFDAHERARIRGLVARFPYCGVVLVTSRDADNARLFRDLPVTEVVWLDDIKTDLRAAVGRASQRRNTERAARQVEAAAPLPPLLSQALAFALRSPDACLSVSDLASVFACDRRALWRLWSRARPARSELRLEDVLGWIVLVRASASKTRTRGWTAIAIDLGLHEHTLSRIARRLTGLTLRQIAAEGSARIWRDFDVRVLGPLRGVTTWDAAGHPAVVAEEDSLNS
ncbi:MAG TPA: hypothetical protein VHM30_04210 [Gemmatimonadaceae bacterium]|nr:hypothetical protein [Gemmatimonadaceae bacterium]